MRPIWYARVELDGNRLLDIIAPLVVVTEALGRTLLAIDPLLDANSHLDVLLERR